MCVLHVGFSCSNRKTLELIIQSRPDTEPVGFHTDSVHSAFSMDPRQMTDRLIRAIENPHVDILGHPTGRLLLKREAYPFDIAAV